MHTRPHAILSAVLTLALGGCAHQYLDPRLYGQVRERSPDTSPGVVQVRFLGVGGFLIERGDDVVMTAPFYTNPDEGFLLGTKQARPNKDLICDLLPGRWADRTRAILIGHSHYDHFMDVPFVAAEIAKDAVLYGSLTMKQLAMAPPYSLPSHRVVVVTDHGGRDAVDYRRCPDKPKEACHHDYPKPGDWIQVNPRVRIRALCSRHASPVPFKGCLTEADHVPEPTRADDWKLGDTFAYLIDFLENGEPVFRVYYQDSATSSPYGYVPEELVADKSVDVALLCGAAFNFVEDNPAGIMENTKPRFVVFGHWENFFKPQTEPLENLYVSDYSDLVRRMEALKTSSGGGSAGRDSTGSRRPATCSCSSPQATDITARPGRRTRRKPPPPRRTRARTPIPSE